MSINYKNRKQKGKNNLTRRRDRMLSNPRENELFWPNAKHIFLAHSLGKNKAAPKSRNIVFDFNLLK